MAHSDNASSARRRALNMIWTAAGEYGFEPEFMAFLQDGSPDFYLNSIIGYVHKWYDQNILHQLYDIINGALLKETFDGLLWIGLENCAFARESACRPVLAEMRAACAESFFAQQLTRSRQQWMAQNSLVYALQEARWRTVLGQPAGLKNPWEKRLFEELNYDGDMDARDIMKRTLDIFRRYFHFDGSSGRLPLSRMRRVIGNMARKALPVRFTRSEDLSFGSSSTGGAVTARKGKDLGPISAAQEERDRLYIENCFGLPLFDRETAAEIDEALCIDRHLGCHIYFTDGRQGTPASDPLIRKTLRDAEAQRDKNLEHFRDRRRIYRNSIIRLARQIENALLVYPQPLKVPARSGRLMPSRVWRALYLNDDRIFSDTYEEEQPDFSVDIMLDASASRLQSQETIAAQGYVIAESLRLCHIPAQIYSFLSLRGHTVIRLFCGYEEKDKEKNIFDYFAAGWNRDGLALRGASRLMECSPARNRILIILTDASPNDDRRIPPDRTDGRLTGRDYSGEAGIEDAAAEVRQLRKDGVRVMAVLNGEDGATEAARKIYGDDFTRIERIENLSDAVGLLIQRQIERMQR